MFLIRKRHSRTPLATPNSCRRIPLSEVKWATNGFDESRLIGTGAFGNVYKGVLRDGTPVAVKVPIAERLIQQFRNEIAVLSRVHHDHVVSLIGYCDEKNVLAIVYEYMSKGTFATLLHGPNSSPQSWKKRLEICISVARGLHYLQEGSRPGIIHRDVKTRNILLGDDYTAKIGSFGSSSSGPREEETHVITAGCQDPQYMIRGHATPKSDVYSFGVMLMEALCGRSPMDPRQLDVVNWAVQMQMAGKVEEMVDARIREMASRRSVGKVASIAVLCLEFRKEKRPNMEEVATNLEYALQVQLCHENGEEGPGNHLR